MRHRQSSVLIVVCVFAVAGCGDSTSSGSAAPTSADADQTLDSPVPTVQAPPPIASNAPPHVEATTPTLDPDFVTAGERALRASPAVVTAIGAAFDIVTVEPVGSYEQPSGIAFMVHTPEPVTMPTGTPTTKSAGEGEPTLIEASPSPMGPLSYFYVIFNGDFADPIFLPVPDVLAEHGTLPN